MEIVAIAYRWEIDGRPHYAFKLNDPRGGFGNMRTVRVKIDSDGLYRVNYLGRFIGLEEPGQAGFYNLQDLMDQGRACELTRAEAMA